MISLDKPLFYIVSSPEVRGVEDLVGKTVAVDKIGTLQEIYDIAYSTQMMPIPVQVKTVMDYTLLDEVLKERASR